MKTIDIPKELQNFVTNNVFGQKTKNSTTTKQKIKHTKLILARAGY